MEKIININFQGRVIPIEETAYNNLKQYIDSLRRHFANEESSEEIIGDIENRIAELLTERLKHGAGCVNNADLNAVIDSIGRLEDIEAAEGDDSKQNNSSNNSNNNSNSGSYAYQTPGAQPYRGRLYRDADDKVIAGVCSGIAIRTGIDPIIVRIAFVLLIGALFWVYILLWVVVPSQSIRSNITRRLYRNPDDKVIAGVCGGLGVYFKTDSRILRAIFVLPIILGIFSRGIHHLWWGGGWWFGPHIIAGSLGSSLFVLYVILWIALPFASSATDKLEMRGEKIDINSIKAASQANAASPGYQKPQSSGFGRIIGILFKAFFLFIAGTMAVSLFGVLIGLFFASTVTIPFTDFLIDGWMQYGLVWASVILFLGVPLLAFVTWMIRRIMGVRSHRHYLGFVFAGLWLVGFMAIISLAAILLHNFSTKAVVEETVAMQQPNVKKLYINVNKDAGTWGNTHYGHWYGDRDELDAPFHFINNDSMWLNNIKVNVTTSADSLYHIYETRICRGNSNEEAKKLASHINFNITQADSIINLPQGFRISNKDKFRNQQVLVTVEVPIGKTIRFTKDVNKYSWYTFNVNGGHEVYYESNDNEDYNTATDYTMTVNGLIDPTDTVKPGKTNDGDDNREGDDDDDDKDDNDK